MEKSNSPIPNPCPVLAAGTSGGTKGLVGRAVRSDCNVDNEGAAARVPDDRRMGAVDSARGRRHPRMRGAWLDEGPQRFPCPRARPSHRPAGSAARVSPEQAVAAVRDVLDAI